MTLLFDHLRCRGKWLYSPMSGTPHLACFITSRVLSSRFPVTYRGRGGGWKILHRYSQQQDVTLPVWWSWMLTLWLFNIHFSYILSLHIFNLLNVLFKSTVSNFYFFFTLAVCCSRTRWCIKVVITSCLVSVLDFLVHCVTASEVTMTGNQMMHRFTGLFKHCWNHLG